MAIPEAYSPRHGSYPVLSARSARTVFTCLAACLLVLASRSWAQEPASNPRERTTGALQQLVDKFRTLLAIERAVSVAIVANNPRAASMVPPGAQGQPFQIAIERAFLESLSDDELEAVMAHELGHVWVATHHPYLQTEELANSIAMRVVTRQSLERVYAKVFARDGTAVDPLRFFSTTGPESGLAPTR